MPVIVFALACRDGRGRAQQGLRERSADLQAGYLSSQHRAEPTREDRAVRENVTISYRGARYEIGRGRHYYGIWTAGEPRSQPLQWWPETSDGWSGAWSRFAAMEAPGSIVPVRRRNAPAAGPRPRIAAALLALGVLFGLIGLFPGYVAGSSLGSTAYQLVPHLIYLAAWAGSAALVWRGGARLQAGALLGAGVSIVTLGLFLSDVGAVIAGGSAGAGLVLALVGWVCCSAGAAAACWLGAVGEPDRPSQGSIGHVAMVVLAGLGAALAFAPAWDSYTLRIATGASSTVTAGNAFAQPGAEIAGNLVVMVAIVAVVTAAALWRPIRHGAILIAGAVIPLAAQAISALIQQLGQTAQPGEFGFTPAEAAREGLTISSGVTAVFWVYCVFVLALAASAAWMFLPADPATLAPRPGQLGPDGRGAAVPGPPSAGTAAVGTASPGTVIAGAVLAPDRLAEDEDDDWDDDDWDDDDDDEDDDPEKDADSHQQP
jgi:hypothetical protein